jgi:hypothetical protein
MNTYILFQISFFFIDLPFTNQLTNIKFSSKAMQNFVIADKVIANPICSGIINTAGQMYSNINDNAVLGSVVSLTLLPNRNFSNIFANSMPYSKRL